MIPTVAGFLIFIRQQMGITTTVLPDASPYIGWAFNVAVEIVNLQLDCISPLIYELAVYNLAADNLINYAQDLPDAAIIPGSEPPAAFFQALRQSWDITGFVPGVISSSADVSTSESLLVPDFMKGLTLADLNLIKTPYGRTYLAFAQKIGTNWGLS
jgi:hypothetical protein